MHKIPPAQSGKTADEAIRARSVRAFFEALTPWRDRRGGPLYRRFTMIAPATPRMLQTGSGPGNWPDKLWITCSYHWISGEPLVNKSRNSPSP
jgi:hypothetical protein